jgi:protease IV
MEKSQLSEDIINSLMQEKAHDRKWRNIRFFTRMGVGLFILFLIFMILRPSSPSYIDKPHAALVKLSGVILPGTSFSANKAIPELQNAFMDPTAKGVIIEINSPGGAVVQSAMIHDAILHFKKEYHKKVIVVGDDMLTSGAYLIATAADKIYVNRDTITGSIGVIMASFDLSGLIKKIGVKRRVFTAGTNKDRLDPFKAMRPEDKTKIKNLLNETHQSFITYVKKSRGDKIKKDDPKKLFSGDFWSGEEALKLGLIDKIGNVNQAANNELNTKIIVDYTTPPSFLRQFLAGVESSVHLSSETNRPQLMAIASVR